MSRTKGITRPGKVPLLTKDQVLSWLPISERTLHRYLDAGKLRAYKLDGLLVFNEADITQFLKKRAIGGGPAAPFENISLPELNPADFRIMTDVEAQAFFANVERDEDGNLMCSPED